MLKQTLREYPHLVAVKTNAEDNPDGYYLMDKADFVEGEHELYEEDETQETDSGATGGVEQKPEGTSETTAPPGEATAANPWAPKV